MTYEDFRKEFMEVLKEGVANDPFFQHSLLTEEMAELAWMAFGRLRWKEESKKGKLQ